MTFAATAEFIDYNGNANTIVFDGETFGDSTLGRLSGFFTVRCRVSEWSHSKLINPG
jgi:hypothetical protein